MLFTICSHSLIESDVLFIKKTAVYYQVYEWVFHCQLFQHENISGFSYDLGSPALVAMQKPLTMAFKNSIWNKLNTLTHTNEYREMYKKAFYPADKIRFMLIKHLNLFIFAWLSLVITNL